MITITDIVEMMKGLTPENLETFKEKLPEILKALESLKVTDQKVTDILNKLTTNEKPAVPESAEDAIMAVADEDENA